MKIIKTIALLLIGGLVLSGSAWAKPVIDNIKMHNTRILINSSGARPVSELTREKTEKILLNAHSAINSSSSWDEVLRFADNLGRLSLSEKNDVIITKPYIQNNKKDIFSLISGLWSKTAGQNVYSFKSPVKGTNIYLYSSPKTQQGFGVLAVNLNDFAVTIRLASPAEVFLLKSERNNRILLNNDKVSSASSINPADLKGRVQNIGDMAIPPRSITFLLFDELKANDHDGGHSHGEEHRHEHNH